MFKKPHIRLNIIDILIILLVLSVILSIGFRIFSSRQSKETSTYDISLICNDCPPFIQKNIHINEECGEYETKQTIGKIKTREIVSQNCLRITLSFEASREDYGIKANGVTYLIGDKIKIVSNNCFLTAQIENIVKVK